MSLFGAGVAIAQTPTQSPTDTVYAPDNDALDVVESGTPTPGPTPPEGTLDEVDTEPGPEAPPTTAAETTPEPADEPAGETQEAQTGQLPFTGFEAGLVGLLGLALLGGGIAMRRFSRAE